MAAHISTDKIKEIQDQYARIGTYSGTARVVGVSPATVKKYVETPPVSSPSPSPVARPNRTYDLPPASSVIVPLDRSAWLTLTKDELRVLNDTDFLSR